MSHSKTINNKSAEKNKAKKYFRENFIVFLVISMLLGIMGLMSTYIYRLYPYYFAYLIILVIWFSIMVIILLKQFLLIRYKDRLLDWIKKYPKKLCLVINISHTVFIFSIMFSVPIVIIAGAFILCFLFMNFSTSFITPAVIRYALLVGIFAGICTLTYLHPSQRDVLLGCTSIKMKKGEWSSLDLYRFSEIKEVLSETSPGRLILASLPLEEIFVMLDVQLSVYNIRSKNLEKLADDTIEYVLYPSESSLSFFKKLKILWNDLWLMQKRFSKDGFNIEGYVKMERERKTKALARYKEALARKVTWINVVTGIVAVIIASVGLFLTL